MDRAAKGKAVRIWGPSLPRTGTRRILLGDFDAAGLADDGDANLAGVLEFVFDLGGEVRIGRCYRNAAPFELRWGFVAQIASRLPVYRCAAGVRRKPDECMMGGQLGKTHRIGRRECRR